MFAYLDGGSVSMFVGAVAAGAAGVGVAMKSKFGMLRSGKGNNADASQSDDTTSEDAANDPAAANVDADT